MFQSPNLMFQTSLIAHFFNTFFGGFPCVVRFVAAQSWSKQMLYATSVGLALVIQLLLVLSLFSIVKVRLFYNKLWQIIWQKKNYTIVYYVYSN